MAPGVLRPWRQQASPLRGLETKELGEPDNWNPDAMAYSPSGHCACKFKRAQCAQAEPNVFTREGNTSGHVWRAGVGEGKTICKRAKEPSGKPVILKESHKRGQASEGSRILKGFWSSCHLVIAAG